MGGVKLDDAQEYFYGTLIAMLCGLTNKRSILFF